MRQSGYKVTIQGFIPIAKGSLTEQAAALTKIDAAVQKGDIAAIAGMMRPRHLGDDLIHPLTYFRSTAHTVGAATGDRVSLSPHPAFPCAPRMHLLRLEQFTSP